MRKFFLGISVMLLSCSGKETSEMTSLKVESPEITSGRNSEEVVAPDRAVYIDEAIAPEVQLEFGAIEEVVNAVVEGKTYPVHIYEGTLMKASGVTEGFELRFEPFDKYDYKTEQTVKSPYDFDLNVMITKEQNARLNFVDYSDETNNLAWDFFENLFTVYYYERDGGNYPLKFINLGKTEWDG